MKLIVGLGNPGRKYTHTRHNLGFFVLDKFLEKQGVKNQWQESKKLQGLTFKPSSKVLFVKPQVFVCSDELGKTIKKLVDFYKTSLFDVLIIHDEFDLNLGDYKLQFNHSSAGHKGVESIINSLGNQEFWRLRVGIGRPPEGMEGEEYVLQEFEASEGKVIENLLPKIFNEIGEWIN